MTFILINFLFCSKPYIAINLIISNNLSKNWVFYISNMLYIERLLILKIKIEYYNARGYRYENEKN
jgi:hypothetical protein